MFQKDAPEKSAIDLGFIADNYYTAKDRMFKSISSSECIITPL